MRHYHEELKNARANPKETWNLLKRLVPRKTKQIKCNFQNPTICACTHLITFFATCNISYVTLAILKPKNTKSTGHDQINLQHIKESLMVTIPYITLIL